MRGSKRRLPVWALGVGIIAILSGLVWRTAVFPRLDKIPSDLHQVLHLQGTWKVLDPATMQPQEIPLAMTEEYRANGTKGKLLLLERQVTASNAGTGEPLERLRSKSSLAVDRASRNAYIPKQKELQPEGQFSFPTGVKQGMTYRIWNPGAQKALPAKFSRNERLDGLDLWVFVTEERNLPLPPQPETTLPLTMDIAISLWVEPLSGTTVAQSSDATVQAIVPVLGRITASQTHTEFASDTQQELLATARSAHRRLLWFRYRLPVLMYVLGGLAIATGAGTLLLRPAPTTALPEDMKPANLSKPG